MPSDAIEDRIIGETENIPSDAIRISGETENIPSDAIGISGETENIPSDAIEDRISGERGDTESISNPLSAVKASVIGVLVDEKIEPVAILPQAGRGRPRKLSNDSQTSTSSPRTSSRNAKTPSRRSVSKKGVGRNDSMESYNSSTF